MKRMRLFIYILSGILITAFQLGCVSPMGMTSSTTPLEGKSIKVIGKGTGYSNWSGAVFGLWSVNRPDIERGIENALKMENQVTILREEDQKELYLKKGAVLSLTNGVAAVIGKNTISKQCRENEGKDKEYILNSQGSLVLKDGKLFLRDKDKELELPPCGIIKTGCGVEFSYAFFQKDGVTESSTRQPASVIIQKVKGDYIVSIDGRPGRLKEDEVMELSEGAVLSKIEGNVLINVRWYERTYFFVFFSLHRVMVSGDIVVFEKAVENIPVADDKNKIEESVVKKTSGKSRKKSR